MASLRIWDMLLPDENVDELASMLEVPSDYPLRSHLIGEWRFSPDEMKDDSIIPNRVKGMPDFVFKTSHVFIKMANTFPDKLASGNLVMENSLIAPQIIYWLCGAGALSSSLDGYNFLSNYMTDEQWRYE
ncbi:MAG: hypothetical protein LUC45_03485 [Paraprevotella sp.]|nr:hypothetical protein [Paraprevotella sp.]